MKKIPRISLLLFFVLNGFLFDACKKETTYDLFPLKVGNEFYYKYEKDQSDVLRNYTKGTETWKVASESEQGSSIKYLIERRFNGIQYGYFGSGPSDVRKDSILISDSLTIMEVNEDKSSSIISLWDFLFNRYQSISYIELEKVGSTISPSLTCVFKADSGLTSYYYYRPPNDVTHIRLHLDSLRTKL